MKGVNIDFCGGEIESAFIKTEWYYDQACGENAKLFRLKFKECVFFYRKGKGILKLKLP